MDRRAESSGLKVDFMVVANHKLCMKLTDKQSLPLRGDMINLVPDMNVDESTLFILPRCSKVWTMIPDPTKPLQIISNPSFIMEDCEEVDICDVEYDPVYGNGYYAENRLIHERMIDPESYVPGWKEHPLIYMQYMQGFQGPKVVILTPQLAGKIINIGEIK